MPLQVKKFLSISLLCLYLVSSAGLTISLHYCGGDLAALGIFNDPSCCCDNVKANKKDDCCKNENKSFKITADQNKAEFAEKKFHTAYYYLPARTLYAFTEKALYKRISLSPVQLPRPPDKCSLIPAYKRNHSFLFYS